jgi:HAE1 family hydrophobic/amphiphilic exporter-1
MKPRWRRLQPALCFLFLPLVASPQQGPLTVRGKVQVDDLAPFLLPPRPGIGGETPLHLSDVIQRVLANDPDLQISRILRQEADYTVTAAKGYYDPTVGLQAYHSHAITPIASVIGGAASGKLTQNEFAANPVLNGSSPWLGSTYNLTFSNSRLVNDSTFATLNPQYPTALTLNLTQPLLRGLRFDTGRYNIQVARKNTSLSQEQLRQRIIEVVTQAIQAYWEVDYALNNLQVQTEAVRLARQQYDSNRRQADQGVLAPIDVIAAQTQVANFEQNALLSQQALTAAENNLKMLMLPDRGDPLWSTSLLPETELDPHTIVPTFDAAVEQALTHRPELSENLINLEVNSLTQKLNQENTRPRIDGFATLTASGLAGAPQTFSGFPGFSFSGSLPPILVGSWGQSLSNIAAGNFTTAKVGVQLSFPLHNRTAEANLALAGAERRRLEVTRSQIAMAVEADVRNALQSITSARARYDAAVLTSRSADEQYASEQRQFQEGTSTVFLVLQRQTDLISARSREVRARADLAESIANLDRATARTLDTHQISVQ